MIYRFGSFDLDTQLLELRCDDTRVSVEPQAFDVLRLLIENRDRLVSKDELIEKVWDGRIISEATLSSSINAVRRAVGDNGKRQEVIRTMPRRGFRFVQSVAVIEDAPPAERGEPSDPRHADSQISDSKSTDAISIANPPTNSPDEVPAGAALEPPLGKQAIFALPALAILPFNNLSADVDQEYFSDGITEDLINAISRIRLLRVVARNSTFSYKGKSPDVRAVARELGVQFVVEGSIRMAGQRIRLTAQLIEGASGNCLWSARYDRKLDEIFDVQDELTKSIVAAMEPELGRAEQERARAVRSEDLSAWDAYQQGMWHFHKWTKEGYAQAERMFKSALALDPDLAPAHCGLANSISYSWFYGHLEEPREILEVAKSHAKRAVELDPLDADARLALAWVYHFNREPELAFVHAETSRAMDPCSARIQYGWSGTMLKLGIAETDQAKIEAAIEGIELAVALSPNDPFLAAFYARLAEAHIGLENYEEAVEWARRAVAEPRAMWPMAMFLASALGHLDRLDEANSALKDLFRLSPDFDERRARARFPFASHEFENRVFEGLNKAGLPT